MPARSQTRRGSRCSGSRRRNGAELVVLAANPKNSTKSEAIRAAREKAERIRKASEMHRGNPSGAEDAAGEMYEQFHGEAPRTVETLHEPEPRPATLSELGDLIELKVRRTCGWKWGSLPFEGRGVKVASNSAGTQLYFVGGQQRLSKGDLTALGADRTKELMDLGECRYIAYRTRKAHLENITATYEHGLGEETQCYPRLVYDRRGPQPRLHLVGGAYHVESAGIVN